MSPKAKFGIAATIVTLVTCVVGAYSTGAGHGDYVLARILLPFACTTIALPLLPGMFVFVIAVVQWPSYFFAVYRVREHGGNVPRVVTVLAVIHAAVTVLTFTLLSGPFS